MEWTEIKIYTTNEGIEPIAAMLIESGISGIQIEDDDEMKKFITTNSEYWDYVDEKLLNKNKEDTHIKVYISNNVYGNEIFLKIKEGLNRLKNMNLGFNIGKLDYKLTNMNDEEWINKWKEYYKPFNVGNKLLIKPVWEEVEEKKDKIIFNINPGQVFGTGLHQTTQLCIIELEKYVNNKTVLFDMGCGSGILSIISLLLGAESASAIDIDANAVKTAYENADLNNINHEKYFVTNGNIIENENIQFKIGYAKYDIVVANIIADVIIASADIVKKLLKQEGIFIASGIIKDRMNDIYEKLELSGFEVINTLVKDEWVCISSKVKNIL